MTTPTEDDQVVELVDHLEQSDETQAKVGKLHRHMIAFLRAQVMQFRETEPETVKLLRKTMSKDVLGDLYESLMDELDDADEWDEQDTIEAAALFMLMTLGMNDEQTRNTAQAVEATSRETDDNEDDNDDNDDNEDEDDEE